MSPHQQYSTCSCSEIPACFPTAQLFPLFTRTSLVQLVTVNMEQAMAQAKSFRKRGYQTKTMLELVGSENRKCFLCEEKHRVSYPIPEIGWDEELKSNSFTVLPHSAYTRGMHEFDLARSQVIPACICKCRLCDAARCRNERSPTSEQGLQSVDLAQGSARCCKRWDMDGTQGVLRINSTNQGVALVYFIEIEDDGLFHQPREPCRAMQVAGCRLRTCRHIG